MKSGFTPRNSENIQAKDKAAAAKQHHTHQDSLLFDGRYKIIHIVRFHGRIKTRRVIDCTNGEVLQIKSEKGPDQTQASDEFQTTLKLLKAVKHPNIIRFKQQGQVLSDEKVINYITTNDVSGGSLQDLLDCSGPLPDPLARYFFRQLV